MGSAFSETRRAARLLQQFGGFPFAAVDDRSSPPCDLSAPYRCVSCSFGTLVRCHIASEVPAILTLELLLSGGGDAVVKVQRLRTQSEYDILIGYKTSITDTQIVTRLGNTVLRL